MSRVFKVLVLVLAFGLAVASSAYADTSWSTEINVEVPLVDVGTLIVTLTDGAISFNPSLATLTNPWIASSGYLKVEYSVGYNATWGIRIVTDNEDLEKDADDVVNIITPCDADGDTAGTQASYSGLLIVTDKDPSKRASLAWQVFANPLVVAPTVPKSEIKPKDSGTMLVDKNTPEADADSIGKWNSAWAYIADKNNYDYKSAILVADNDDNDDGIPGGPGDLVNDYAYPMVLVGPSGGGGGTLAQHPQKDPAAGDGDISIYLAARFANTNWGDVSKPFPYILPAGKYSASLYLELIHE